MRLYKLFYVGDVEGSDDYNEAREEFEAARVGEILEDGTIGFELDLMDVQQYPAEAGTKSWPTKSWPEGPIEPRHAPLIPEAGAGLVKNLVNSESGHGDKPSEGSFTAGIVPEAQVVHPWDQGAWIFPEDHPLHAVEMAAKLGSQSEIKRELANVAISLPAPEMLEP